MTASVSTASVIPSAAIRNPVLVQPSYSPIHGTAFRMIASGMKTHIVVKIKRGRLTEWRSIASTIPVFAPSTHDLRVPTTLESTTGTHGTRLA